MLFFVTATSIAQTENINSDRPDQSDGVYTVPQKKFQLENGITITNQTLLNNFMLRYGLTNSTEIRLLLDAGKEKEGRGLKPVTISAKQQLIKQHKAFPAITLVGYISVERFASKDFDGLHLPYELKLAFENELSDKFSLAYNIGASNEFKSLNLTLNAGYSPTQKITTFVEYFSSINKSDANHNIDVGILFVINPSLQIDFACGNSIFSSANNVFATLGISYIFR